MENYTVVIIGGGLVGSLLAVTLAKRGWNVELYELRKGMSHVTSHTSDPRTQALASGRSINLALSVRGLEALKAAGIAQDIIDTLIPMRGRLIHSLNGQLSRQAYGLFGECINSVDRKFMNEHLLSSAEALPNVSLFFEHSVQKCDFDRKRVVFERKDGTIATVQGDLIIGTDGAYSKVRSQLMRSIRMDYAQEYIDHGYVELNIPPTQEDAYAMDPDHLHIWPRHTFMMIALPNRDCSFTVTLFMPWAKFDAITDEAALIQFFDETFPDAVALIGKELLIKDYFKNPKGSLISIKCKPYHYRDRALILGDAAHAMVPFYGQGMNCGFEDVLVLDEILTKHLGPAVSSPTTEFIQIKAPSPKTMEAALLEYSLTRNPDAEAMCDLALYNYEEMRSSVVQPGYLIRKRIEGTLHRFFPKSVIPLYTMVSFTRIPYSEVVRRWKRQTRGLELLRQVGIWILFGYPTFLIARRLLFGSLLSR